VLGFVIRVEDIVQEIRRLNRYKRMIYNEFYPYMLFFVILGV